MSRLSAITSPDVGDNKPHITFSKVVLPTPEGPTSAIDSPGSTCRLKLEKIGCENGSY